MTAGTVTLDSPLQGSDLTVTIRTSRTFRARTVAGCLLIRLAGRILGAEKVDVAVTRGTHTVESA